MSKSANTGDTDRTEILKPLWHQHWNHKKASTQNTKKKVKTSISHYEAHNTLSKIKIKASLKNKINLKSFETEFKKMKPLNNV